MFKYSNQIYKELWQKKRVRYSDAELQEFKAIIQD